MTAHLRMRGLQASLGLLESKRLAAAVRDKPFPGGVLRRQRTFSQPFVSIAQKIRCFPGESSEPYLRELDSSTARRSM